MYSKVSNSIANNQIFSSYSLDAKQYWNDDSRLISLSELIAVEHSAIWRKWATCKMTSQTSSYRMRREIMSSGPDMWRS